MNPCWNCNNHNNKKELFCSTCKFIQPMDNKLDFFEILGFPKTFFLKQSELEQSFKNLNRKLHPDKFATSSPKERRLSLEHATSVNDAYRTLREPIKKIEYLLSLYGRTIDSSSNNTVPLDFLEQIMEQREQIATAKMEHSDHLFTDSLNEMEDLRNRLYLDIEKLFESYENSSQFSHKSDLLDDIVQVFLKIKYINNILLEYGMKSI